MNKFVSRMVRTGAILLAVTPFLSAGDQGVDVAFKVRTGFNASTPDDNLQSAALGFGVNFGWAVGSGKINTELGYFYKPGRQYRQEVFLPAVPGSSADSRKNSLTQINLRLSWEAPINDTWSWQAGLMLGNTKFRHEYFGDISDGASFEDTYNGTPTKTSFSVSPFIGLSYKVSDVSNLELNLIDVTYKSYDFVHTPGSAIISGDPNRPGSHLVYAGDHFNSPNRNSVHIEIGYAFHF